MKRLFAAVLCLLLLCTLVLAAPVPAESAEITSYHAQAVIDENGAMEMSVTIALSIPSPLQQLDFPIGAGVNGAVAGQKVKAVKTDEGTLLRLTSEAGISGERTFVITYTLPRVIADTDEGQTLTLELIAAGWAWPMEKVSFQVTMPAEFEELPVYTGGYYLDLVEDYMNLQCDALVFSGSFLEPLRDHDTLAVSLALPESYVDLLSARGLSGVVTLILVLLICALCVLYWVRTLRNRSFTVRLRPLPPDGAGAGDLPFLAAGAEPSLALQVMQWASMGYLVIHKNAKGRLVLRQTMPMGTERRKQERLVFAALFERNPWFDGESLRFGRVAGRYASALRAWWSRRIFSKRSGSPSILRLFASLACGIALLGSASLGLPVTRARAVLLLLFAALGVAMGLLLQRATHYGARRQLRPMALYGLSLVVLLFSSALLGGRLPVLLAAALQIFAAYVTLRGGRRNAGGRDNLAQTIGFTRYLQHVSQHQLVLALRDDPQYFYRILPYAEALGLGASFAARFGDLQLEPCAWFETPRQRRTTATGFYESFKESLTRMERAVKK